ncbi:MULTISPECIES: rhomboid family intramembrane serine protease [unclassified Flavobacterium]|uniref:rhomboid family intramembrane serine protease n=1 Tax=unclassified Flavobacterium TaxID=196869 RepID=UPI000F0CEF6E|nr:MULTISPECIES: rhomboid family intramembrane serine protease [unclassified Flavobacterium]AYN05095.1 rhomboid family intramembrane serine protease [Flavobacterium sp. 140616W15]MCD0473785.1 rhomboid family intramembrane serine protease [Flavobacterium sp. EDS]
MMNMTPLVKQLLIINIIFFLGSQLVPVSYEYFSLYFPENYQFKIWQPITHMFMHGGFMHIAFNMFALVSFGSALEHFWGGKKFLFFYISCGLGAALLQLGFNYLQIQNTLEAASTLGLSDNAIHQILNVNFTDGTSYRGDLFMDGIRPILEKAGKINLLNEVNFKSLFDASIINQTPMVGASGAIYGLLVAFAFMFPNAELALMFIPVPIKAKYFVPGIIAVDLFLGFQGNSLFGSGGTGIAHFAHVGGALVGYLMMWYWKKTQFNNNRWN